MADSKTDIPDDDKILAVIPARYDSSRFSGKPLVHIQGKPMIQHVWQRVRQCPEIDRVIIATDDTRIQDTCQAFGAEVAMTSAEHPSGTDRVWEVAKQYSNYTWILNVQGDEPQIDPNTLRQAIACAKNQPEADIVTLVSPIESLEDFLEPNIVKAILAKNRRALYFTRAAAPTNRDNPQLAWQSAKRHVGVYLYRQTALAAITQLPPSPLELQEKLEQLRALEAGLKIWAVEIPKAPIGVDCPEDLKKLSLLFKEKPPLE